MKKTAFFIILLQLFVAGSVRADEGMWLPLFIERLNYVDMQKEGLHLTAEEIYSVNHSSLKDAVIIFGGGCTGEMVSNEGLVLTNHHCGYGAIQSHSAVDHDYLTDGFWAMNHAEELPNDGLKARFLLSITDVTKDVLDGLKGLSETDRADKIKEIAKKLELNAIRDSQYDAKVSAFFNGNEYYLFVYETFRDVRLVGAPPSSIGKFGADTDNWMWPRHTADFSVFRVYTSPDGKPADYAGNNVPLKPKHHLPVSIKGVQKNDFAMIMGYPGRTTRYMTSFGVNLAIEKTNPAIVKIRTRKLEIMKADMDASAAIRIQYASKYAGSANYWKFYIGQTKGLKSLKVFDKKRELESQFTQWLKGDNDRSMKYKEVLPDLANAFEAISATALATTYNSEAINQGSEIIRFAKSYQELADELAKPSADAAAMKNLTEKLGDASKKYFKDYNAATDTKLLAAMLELYRKDIDVKYQPTLLGELDKKYKGDFKAYADMLFSKSLFASQEKVNAFLKNPSLKSLQKDPCYKLMTAFSDAGKSLDALTQGSNDRIVKGNRLFMEGLQEMQPDKKFYPDANSTMRLTYGKVLDYYPADAVHYDYITTLKGVMDKEDSTSWEFKVPAKLKQLYQKKDYGRYSKNGEMVTCFITNNDITGGNSGSPVINADGELIGLAFDGNWEAMSGNIAFEPDLQRTICVDIRYVLFIIDKYAGASNLIKEMDVKE